MKIPKHELYDFSGYPEIQQALREYITFGAITDFEEFVHELNGLIADVEYLRETELRYSELMEEQSRKWKTKDVKAGAAHSTKR